MEYETTCVMIGRKPRVGEDPFKTLSIGLYSVNDPHKAGAFPTKTLDFPNIESLTIEGVSVSYYLEGNDIIINNLTKVTVIVDGTKAVIKGA